MRVLCFFLLNLIFLCESRGEDFDDLPREFRVGSKLNPGQSCKDIKARGGTVTGNYYIRLGGRTFMVHCDQTIDGGGWTLVYSYTFTDYNHFDHGSNAVTPRPSWPSPGDVRLSTTTPLSETDYNAMDFKLWRKLGKEVLLKSNLNNWYACTEGTGSLLRYVGGGIKCRLVRNFTGMCANVVPNMFTPQVSRWNTGPNIYSDISQTPRLRSIYYYNTFIIDDGYPSHDPCNLDLVYKSDVKNPHGNIYVR